MEFEATHEIPIGLNRVRDYSSPQQWASEKAYLWEKGEEKAYSTYKEDSLLRLEKDWFFNDFFLAQREPLIGSCAIASSVCNVSYYLSSQLVAFDSLFLCDFRDTSSEWHGLKVSGTIGIIPRKTFSQRLPILIEKSTGLPFIRIDNLEYIRTTVSKYPRNTNFSFCAHFQPDSILLLKNLVRLRRYGLTRDSMLKIPKIQGILPFLTQEILETFEFQEKVDSYGTSYIVGLFTS